jgi:polyisoprenoid-binding protein YceI
MKTPAILCFAMCIAIIPTIAQNKIDFSQFYPIDRGHSFVEFSIKYMGYAKMKGRFADFSGMVRYDEKAPERTSVTLVIKTESIDTDSDFRDNDLKSDNWFDAKQFPFIIFKSKSVQKSGEGFIMLGDLTMKGVTKEISVKMDPPSGVLKDIRQDHQAIFTGTASLDRTHYGVEGKNWSAVKEGITAVGNEVTIDFSILGKQVKLANFANRVKNPDSPTGKIYKAVKDQGIEKGVEVFKSLKSSETIDRGVLSTVGYMLVLEGNTKDAIALYELNRETFPELPEVYYDLGEVYGFSGDVKKSRTYFEEAVKRNPTHAWSMEVLRHF